MVKSLGRHVHCDVRSGRGSIRASARARPLTKKELFQIIPMHMMTREIIPGRKTEGSTVSSINWPFVSDIVIRVLKRDVKLQLTNFLVVVCYCVVIWLRRTYIILFRAYTIFPRGYIILRGYTTFAWLYASLAWLLVHFACLYGFPLLYDFSVVIRFFCVVIRQCAATRCNTP